LRQHGAVDELPDLSSIRFTRKGVVPSIIFQKDTNSLNHFTLFEAIGRFNYPFPDLTNVKIHREGDPKSGGKKELSINVLTATNTLDCAKDIWLEFGDVIEIPEREHTLAEREIGLTDTQLKGLRKCLERKVTFVVKGQRLEITPNGMVGVNDLSSALKRHDVREILRSSSDLSRLLLKRTDPVTKKSLKLWVEPKSGPDDLWLRDGDVIEVPDKS
jgi:hypothetical protein